MSADRNVSIVEYMAEHRGYPCGYCKSKNTNNSHGMWAHSMTVSDYQDLIDRGWRRSGKYCYKPTMNLTCCPQYAIKCDALEFKLSKSQKNVLKKMNKYLSTGEIKPETVDIQISFDDEIGLSISDVQVQSKLAEDKLLFTDSSLYKESDTDLPGPLGDANPRRCSESSKTSSQSFPKQSETKLEKQPKPGLGADPNKPPCKKAKLVRLERRKQKSKTDSLNLENPSALKQDTNCCKTIENYLNVSVENPVHKLEILLVRSNPKSIEFKRTLKQSHELYSKYQQTVHNDPPNKCKMDNFVRFLVNSPLEIRLLRSNPPSEVYEKSRRESLSLYKKYQMQIHNDKPFECDENTFSGFLETSPLKPESPSYGPSCGYGSFHQQYWLDGKLIAVGVMDVLPHCVSSVYFYYDPDYRFLTLGTYASLREIAFTRELQKRDPKLKYYYMGFYIHSCPKMRYKGQYKPSFLLCPEVYSWHVIEDCREKLDRSKYSRLNEDLSIVDGNVTDIQTVCILYQRVAMPYASYKRHRRQYTDSVDEEQVVQYSRLVGGHCARKILLFRQ
uniref:Arginyl-tRNA--protein transferase 1 n=1 Tax=Strigamia maritima TaxID=126957 RepID=T1J3H9_STRMM